MDARELSKVGLLSLQPFQIHCMRHLVSTYMSLRLSVELSVCLSVCLSTLQKLNEQRKVLEHADEFPDNANTEAGRLRKQLLQVCAYVCVR